MIFTVLRSAARRAIVSATLAAFFCSLCGAAKAQDTNIASAGESQQWNLHVQNTDIVQGDPGFPAKYSGPNSFHSYGEDALSRTMTLYTGVKLFRFTDVIASVDESGGSAADTRD